MYFFQAMGNPTVNLLILDIEGAELSGFNNTLPTQRFKRITSIKKIAELGKPQNIKKVLFFMAGQ